jgi:hypothetical protein
MCIHVFHRRNITHIQSTVVLVRTRCSPWVVKYTSLTSDISASMYISVISGLKNASCSLYSRTDITRAIYSCTFLDLICCRFLFSVVVVVHCTYKCTHDKVMVEASTPFYTMIVNVADDLKWKKGPTQYGLWGGGLILLYIHNKTLLCIMCINTII